MSAMQKMKNNELMEMIACIQLWDYLHVEDVARMIVALIESDNASDIYNIASGEKRLLQELVEDMKEVLKSMSELRFGAIPYGDNEPVELRLDNGKLMAL